ncbi:NAD(P)-binding domain-containing protein [Mesorhizobium sp. AaZ16]|uniref:NAD(P)-binding domain-containing protein n=1 Tax=Mesorhizobium sp. AaZ16 TaxID=3402289 RepID=UPI00374EAD67
MIKTDASVDEYLNRVGILGAGRLGSALASRLGSTGANVPLWSRRHERGDQLIPQGGEACGAVDFDTIAKSYVLLSAIPNQALLQLSSRQRLRNFDGVVCAMGIDTSVRCVREAFPQALVLRLSPGIPQAGGDITSVGLLDAYALRDSRVDVAKAVLELLGPVVWIDEENLYDLTSLLAGPLLTLLKSAISRTVEVSLEANGLPSQFKEELERIVFNELARRSLGISEGSRQVERDRATPGGVTEVALRHQEQISGQLLGIVELMLKRMARLR